MGNEFNPAPPGMKWPPAPPKFFGLKELTIPTDMPLETPDDIVAALQFVFPKHRFNAQQSREMYARYMNDQPILNKCTICRPEINNIVVENWLWAVVQFKMGFESPDGAVFNSADKKPDIKAIDVLNKCARLADEHADSQEADMWKYVTGTSFRICRPEDPAIANGNPDVAPYYTATLNPERAGVVYSDSPRKRRVLGFSYSEHFDLETKQPTLHVKAYTNSRQYEWEVKAGNNPFYTPNGVFNYAITASDAWTLVGDSALFPAVMPIVEKKLNPNRMGYVALLASLQDAMNKLQSARLDGVENFIESLMVFINCQPPTDEETGEWKPLSSGQQLSVKGTPEMPASVQYLVQQLDQGGTQITKDDLLDAFFEIAGMPSRAARQGGGEATGQAAYLSDGWADAGTRANIAEVEARKAEMDLLLIKLPILRAADTSEEFDIGDMTRGDVYVDFPRTRNNNMLVKVQALQILIKMGVDIESSFQVVDLFDDPNAVAQKSKSQIDALLNPANTEGQNGAEPNLYNASLTTSSSGTTPDSLSNA